MQGVVLEDCQLSASSVNVQFAKSFTDRVLSNFDKQVNKVASSVLRKHLCSKFATDLLPVLTDRLLQKTSEDVHLFDAFHLDSKLVRPIEFQVRYDSRSIYST